MKKSQTDFAMARIIKRKRMILNITLNYVLPDKDRDYRKPIIEVIHTDMQRDTKIT